MPAATRRRIVDDHLRQDARKASRRSSRSTRSCASRRSRGATSCLAFGPPKSSANRRRTPRPMPRRSSPPTSRRRATRTCFARSAATSTPPASTIRPSDPPHHGGADGVESVAADRSRLDQRPPPLRAVFICAADRFWLNARSRGATSPCRSTAPASLPEKSLVHRPWSGVPDPLTDRASSARAAASTPSRSTCSMAAITTDSVLRGIAADPPGRQAALVRIPVGALRHGEPGARFRRRGGDRADGQFGRGRAGRLPPP